MRGVFGSVRCCSMSVQYSFQIRSIRHTMIAESASAMKKELEAILDSLPSQPPRSRLDPYAELIDELRRRNWTYRGIAQVLAEKCNLKISPSNIHHFMKL